MAAENADLRHTRLAKELFNRTWDLLDRDRTPEGDAELLGTALASWYHWRRAGDAENHAISDWQVARVLAVLGDGRRSASYAETSLALCRDHDLGPFLTGYAYEGLARAAWVAGDLQERDRMVIAAREAASEIPDGDDRQMLLDDLDEIGA
jgi:hypothetical protein